MEAFRTWNSLFRVHHALEEPLLILGQVVDLLSLCLDHPLLELNKNADGSVTVPEALRPYMNGMERIEPKS